MQPVFPPEYVVSIRRMVKALKAAAARGQSPRFRMPPPDILFVAALDTAASRICVNDDARNLIPALMHAANGDATCFMLRVALGEAGMDYDIVSLGDLGLVQGTS